MTRTADLMLGIGSALTVAASMLNFVALSDQPDVDRSQPWRARVVAAYRRHPRIRGTATVCLAASVIAYVGFAVTV